jgi:acyl carrier protein
MTTEEKIKLIEDTLDLSAGTLTELSVLSDIPQYDSMSKLEIIVLFDDEFHKKLAGEQIKTFNIVKDIIDLMD